MSDFSDLTPLFTTHDLIPDRRGDWWLVDGLYPAIRAETTGTLSIDVALTDSLHISETYPAADGLSLFRDGALPLLLSAFWNRHNAGQVTRHVIKRDDGPWQMLVGRYLRQVETGERPPVPYLFFETIESFLQTQWLKGDICWLSMGIAIDEDGPYADIRLNNMRQPQFEAQVRALDWLYDGRDYSLRHAILMMKV